MINLVNITGPISRKAGGLFTSVRRLCQSLKEQGVRVHVFGVSDEFSGEDKKHWDPLEITDFPPLLHQQFGYSKHFIPALSAIAPELIHAHGIWVYSSMIVSRMHRRNGTPYIISPHGMLDPWAVRNSRWKKWIAYYLFEKEHLRNASCIRALCESEAESIRAFGLKNPIAIIPNGIDLPGEAAAPTDPGHPVAQLRAQGRKVLLYLGRIHPKKGLPNLLRAWAAIPRPQEWVLVIAGWDQGGHEEELRQLAVKLGVARANASAAAAAGGDPAGASVLFIGPQFDDDKSACYRESDAFILPSFSEGVPMVVLEAWAYRKPVVITPECNLPMGFAAGAALRIETDQASIQRGLEALFALSETERMAMGERGRELVVQRFSWQKVAADMVRVYQWILGRGPQPDTVRLD